MKVPVAGSHAGTTTGTAAAPARAAQPTQLAKAVLAPAPAHGTSAFEPEASSLQASLMANKPVLLAPRMLRAEAPWSYEEIVASPFNAALIETSAQQIRKALEAKGIAPESAAFTFLVDITGKQTSVCSACNIEGHDYKPVNVRRDNPEINMLDEYFAVTRETALKAGIKFAIIAYDEEVLPVRGLTDTNSGDHDLNLFRTFRERHPETQKTIINGVMQDSMAEELARWKPEDAVTPKVGLPDDRLAFDIAARVMSGFEGRKNVMVAKSQAPVSIRPMEALLRAKGVTGASGVAVGTQAEEVAKAMFKKTLITHDMHGLRAQVAPAVKLIIDTFEG